MWLALRLCGPPLALRAYAEPLPPLISVSLSQHGRLHRQRYPFHSRPLGWDVGSGFLRCRSRPPGQRTLRKGSTSAPLLTATSSTVSGSHPRAATVQTLVGSPRRTYSPHSGGACATSVLDLTTAVSALRLALQRLPRQTALSLHGWTALPSPGCRHPGLLRLRRKGTCAGVPQRSPAGSRAPAPQVAGCLHPACLACASLSQHRALHRVHRATPLEQSAEVQGAPQIKPLPQASSHARAGRRFRGAASSTASAALLSVEVQRWHQRHHSLLHKQQHPRQGAEVQCCRRHQPPPRAAAARQQGTQGSEG
jgi:hypothetical protein